MSNSVFLFVKYNGQWDENNVYKAKDTLGILVPSLITFRGLLEMLFEELQITPFRQTIELKYETEGVFPPVKIINDRSLKAYLELKKNEANKTMYTLCVQITMQPMRHLFIQTANPRFNLEAAPVRESPAVESTPHTRESVFVDAADLGVRGNPVDITSPYSDGVGLDDCVGLDDFTTFHNLDDLHHGGAEDVTPIDCMGPDEFQKDPSAAGPSNAKAESDHRRPTDNARESDVRRDGESVDRPPADAAPSSAGSRPYSSSSEYDVLDIHSPTIIKLKGLYANKRALQRHLQLFAINNHFKYKVRASSTTSLHVVCFDDNCKWAVRAIKIRRTHLFQVKRYDSIHTCSTDIRQGEHPQATAILIGECIKHKYVDAARSVCRPNDIISFMQQDYGVNLSYKKAWRSKEKALESLYGTDDESYAFLPTLSYMMETMNPGSVIEIVTDRNDRFKYYFMSLSAFIEGWQHCRPVLVVDGTFLKSYYRGTLFTACAMDANEQIFPLAFGVGDAESNESWEFFFTKLKQAIGDRPDLAIVSDRHTGIINAIRKVYPNAYHGYCMHHLLGNLKKKFKKATLALNWKFINAAKAYTVSDWEKYMRLLDVEDRGIRQYLDKEVGHEKWARCLFSGKRYSIMTSNNAESMNSMDVKPREFPISKLIDFLRERMQEWFYERREKAAGTLTILSRKAQIRMDGIHANSTGMTVKPSSVYEFEVIDRDCRRWAVNLVQKTCTCREFQIDQFICAHAVAACRVRGFSVFEFISPYYKKEKWAASYAGVVHPSGGAATWVIPEEIKKRVVKPPFMKSRRAGRPKKRRIPSQGEETPRQKCSRCGKGGHNRQTCRSAVPLSQSRKTDFQENQ